MQADASAGIVGCWQANNAIYRLDNLAALTAEQVLNSVKLLTNATPQKINQASGL
jgi:hypothetical protein